MSRQRASWKPYVALTSTDLHDQMFGRPRRRRRLRVPTPAPTAPVETWQAAIWGAVSGMAALVLLLAGLVVGMGWWG